MANGYLPTGISATPINIAGAGQNLMQAAVEQKLLDIEQGRAIADESQQAALEAMSMKAIQGLDRKLQEKYEADFDAHQAEIRDMLSKGDGVLTRPQQMMIRNKQQDIINRTMADNEAMKARDNVRKFMLDPNTKFGYDVDAIARELSQWDKAFEKGEYLGDPNTILFKHQLEAPVGGYIADRYQSEIDKLDVETLGDFKGNVFTETRLEGLNVEQADSIRKVQDLVNRIMQDPNVRSRYVARDGSVFEEEEAKVRQQIEDAISRKISETKPYRQTGTGRTQFSPYVIEETVEESVPVGDDKTLVVSYDESMPMQNITAFYHDGYKTAVESVGYLPVAKDKEGFKKWALMKKHIEKGEKQPMSEHGIIPKDLLDSYGGEVEYMPFAKVGRTKSKNPFDNYANMFSNVPQKDIEVTFLPFDEKLKGSVLAKTSTRKDSYEAKFNELEQKMRGMKRQAAPKKYSKDIEATISAVMKQNPSYTREEIIKELGL